MRRADWPERLAETIKDAQGFDENYYCLTFAADCVQAMTGIDYLEDYRGLTIDEAREKFKETEHHSFYHYLVSTFGQPVPLSKAQRGDLVVQIEPELCVGICMGQNTAFVSDDELTYKPTLSQRWAFRVS
jgi:hypothetical protein